MVEQVEVPEPVIDPIEQALPDVVAVTPPAEETSSNTGSTAITALQVDPRYPITRPMYPASSVRKAEEGTVELLLYVLPNGRVGDAKVSRSSGFQRLDEAAIREAKRSWRFIPATSGGQAVGSWGTFAVTFKLES
jgi:protein TonB